MATILIRVGVTHWDSSNPEHVHAHVGLDARQPRQHTDTQIRLSKKDEFGVC